MADTARSRTIGTWLSVILGLYVAIASSLIYSMATDIQRTLGGLTERADNADKINDQQAQDIRDNSGAIGVLSSRMSAAEARQSGMQRALQDYGAQINAVRSRQDAMRRDLQRQDQRIQHPEGQ